MEYVRNPYINFELNIFVNANLELPYKQPINHNFQNI